MNKRFLGIVSAMAVMSLQIGVAQTVSAPAQTLADQLRKCAAEPQNPRRLACYDRLSAAVTAAASPAPSPPTAVITTPAGAPATASPRTPAAKASAPPVVTAATTATTNAAAATVAPTGATAASGASQRATDTSDFGVGNGPLEAKQQKGKPQQMSAVVAAVSTKPRGELQVTLDNGQVWVQNQAVDYFPLKAGDKVEINVGALGSYVMWVPSSRRAAKVTRVY
jgi:hypothetical protein